jgi:hypothetical protein
VNLLGHITNWEINKKITHCGPRKEFHQSRHPHLLQNSFDFLHTWTGCRIRKERVPASWGVVEAVLSSTQVEYEFRVLDEVLLTRCAWYHGVHGQGAGPIGSAVVGAGACFGQSRRGLCHNVHRGSGA